MKDEEQSNNLTVKRQTRWLSFRENN
jgi:hypothetical protein